MEDEFPGRCCGIDRAVTDRSKADTLVAQYFDQRNQMRHGATEPIQPQHQQHVALLKFFEAGIEAGSLRASPGSLVDEDVILAAAVFLESIDL